MDVSFPAEDPLTIFRDQADNVWLGFQAGGIVMQDERGYHDPPLFQDQRAVV
jgi:hypothetical protein